MAVIVKYVVERNGVEKMTFTSKKEADNYDKMLDVADQLAALLRFADKALSEDQAEQLGYVLARNAKTVQSIYKGSEFSAELIEE